MKRTEITESLLILAHVTEVCEQHLAKGNLGLCSREGGLRAQ